MRSNSFTERYEEYISAGFAAAFADRKHFPEKRCAFAAALFYMGNKGEKDGFRTVAVFAAAVEQMEYVS